MSNPTDQHSVTAAKPCITVDRWNLSVIVKRTIQVIDSRLLHCGLSDSGHCARSELGLLSRQLGVCQLF